MTPVPFEIARTEGGFAASNGAATVSLLDEGGRMFRRRAIKRIGGGDPQPIEWVVAELDGVRVYFDGAAVVVTRQDLNP